MAQHGVSEQELDNLSEIERTALQDSDAEGLDADDEEIDTRSEGDTEADRSGSDDDDEDDAATDVSTKTEGDDQDQAHEAKAAEDDADRKAADDQPKQQSADDQGRTADDQEAGTDEEGDEPFVHVYRAETPENYDERMAAFDEAYQGAIEKYEAGDMTLPEMLSEHRRIENERNDLQSQYTKAQIAAESEQQAIQQRWDYECKRFFRDVRKDEGIDYMKSPVLFDALNAKVKDLAAKEENVDRGGDWLLNEAHKEVRREMRSAFGEPAPNPGERTGGKKPKAQAIKEAVAKRSDRGHIPNSVRTMPAASDATADEESQFDYIDALYQKGDIEAAERELAKLGPEKEQLYLAGG